jgi:hypothetical protein
MLDPDFKKSPGLGRQEVAMEVFWIFFAIPSVGLLYTICIIGRERESASEICACALHPCRIHSSSRHREVLRISTKDLRYLAYKSDDLILIDLGSGLRGTPIPLPAAHILSASPDELEGLLRWLPAATGVALRGATDVCASAIQICHGIAGTAPIYILADAPAITQIYEAKPENRSTPRPDHSFFAGEQYLGRSPGV